MVAGGVLGSLHETHHDGLHSWPLGSPSKGSQAMWERVPADKTIVRTDTSFNDHGGEKGGPAKKMGLTEEEEVCECTDPEKKKKRGKASKILGNIPVLGRLFGGANHDHDEVLDSLRRQQEAAERGNANTVVRGPYSTLTRKLKALEKEILKTEEEYAAFKHKHDEYRQAYSEVARVMKWHCNGLRRKYKGIRFDCERERVEAQAQFFARRFAPDCLIGRVSPFDESSAVGQASMLPPEVLVLSNIVLRDPSGGFPNPALAPPPAPRQELTGQARWHDATARAFL